MGIVDFSTYLSSLIEAGSQVEGTAVKILADNGREIGEGVFKVIQGGNGVASEVAVGTQSTAGATVATGTAYMTVAANLAAAAIAPCLGVIAGFGLYELSPDFWTGVSNQLVSVGQTIGGDVLAYWNGENLYFDQDTIEIFKNAFIEAGIFDDSYTPPDVDYDQLKLTLTSIDIATCKMQCAAFVKSLAANVNPEHITACLEAIANYNGNSRLWVQHYYYRENAATNYSLNLWTENVPDDEAVSFSISQQLPNIGVLITNGARIGHWTVGQYYGDGDFFNFDIAFPNYIYRWQTYTPQSASGVDACMPHFGTYIPGNNVQPGAVTPSIDIEIPITYPNWVPFPWSIELPDPSLLPDIFPVKYPGIGDDPYPEQDPAQNPQPEPVPEVYPEIIPRLPLPEPGVIPQPEPEVDPDPKDEEDPIDDDAGTVTEKDPVDPNEDPDPSTAIVVPPLPDTVNSNRLFTVYNPTASQLDDLGGYLWDTDIIATLRDIWQDPLDGVISLIQVYATPTTSGNQNIILGFLDTHISSKVVSSQFKTIDCGSVTIPEDKKNATDYAPYSSLHLFLPFIGIVELDTDECMNSTIGVKYKVDMYTGTCLAEVKITRNIDMPNGSILYTYSGNCSQQIPLTSGNMVGTFTALMSGVTAAITCGSGGALSVLAGAKEFAGHSLTHEMTHINHSGNLSANAGIMGQKKPYIIIGRRHCYDANSYNNFYGFPANKTVIVGNCSGFIEVKKCWLKTSATKPEYEEIMRLLAEGVFV